MEMLTLLVFFVRVLLYIFLFFPGYFPLPPSVCVAWATVDVLLCTASIWHMCTMSMDRYFTLKYPMRYGRNKTKTMVALKITFVWVISIAICSPLCIMGYVDYSNVYNNNNCIPAIREFVLYGSIFAFFIPLGIMVVTYTLTIRILCTNQQLMTNLVQGQTRPARFRRERLSHVDNNYLSPDFIPRLVDRPSFDTSLSFNASVNESTLPATSDSDCDHRKSGAVSEGKDVPVAEVGEGDCRGERTLLGEPSQAEDALSVKSCQVGGLDVTMSQFASSRSTLSVSQPHLPSMHTPTRDFLSPNGSQTSLCPHSLTRTKSHLSVCALESVQNFDSLVSLNSVLSSENFGCDVWSNFEDPDMFEKLSQIEAEMDECLTGSKQPSDSLSLVLSPTDSAQSGHFGPMFMVGDSQVMVRPASVTDLGDSHHRHTDNPSAEPDVPSRPSVQTDTIPVCPPVMITTSPASSHSAVNSTVSSKRHSVSSCHSCHSCDPSQHSSQDDVASNPGSPEQYRTINLKPSGCYLYRVETPPPPPVIGNGVTVSPPPSLARAASPTPATPFLRQNCSVGTDLGSLGTDDYISDGALSFSTTSGGAHRKYATNMAVRWDRHKKSAGYGSGWKTFLRRKQKSNGFCLTDRKQSIPKRTASNERKASKVLGIIFAVFVALWTPFFIVNMLSAVCLPCVADVTPPVMVAITWFGYLSSFTNPIIYTMFNTAFRRAFHRILTCGYRRLPPDYRNTRRLRGGTLYMTTSHGNHGNWSNHVEQRNSITVTCTYNG